ncbi:MAG: macro domain-containing protein, partial [Clostridia bacterium]|nr:macro domain-containing protein [Clostridia bacterium]
ANKALLGGFLAGPNCIDNTIHSCAGMQLRDDCAKIIAAQGREEECGDAKATCAYNLPSKFVLHTVGPMVGRGVREEDKAALRSCYVSCLDLAEELGLKSIAFCCIGTGVFNFPQAEAAEIASGAAVSWKLRRPESGLRIIFNTFLPRDTEIYSDILKMM